ncbi:MAG: Ferrochelatase [Haliscomenobacter sp.]|jgi:ferrochelatase|nr:Ferrochelatase [Haliscomenobacter sp.]
MMPQPTTGVLLVNLGTPDTPTRSAVYRYLKQFLLDPRVIDYPWLPRNLLVRGIIAPFRSGSSSRLYQRLWTENGSPLKFYGERLAAGLQQALGETYAVELGMRYQNPSVESAVDRLMQRQVQRIVVLPLFPQYASATTGSVHEEVMRILKPKQVIPELVLVNSYYDYDPMIRLFAGNARQFQLDSYDHVIFSYHGLPQRQLRKADAFNHCLQTSGCCQCITPANQFCYSAQCHATTAAIVAQLELPEGSYTTTFQSRLGPEKWAQPYTSEVLDGLAANGAKRVLVFSPAFVADCLETLVEIGYEYQHRFEEKGGKKVDLVPSLNDHPDWIQAVKTLVLRYAK